MINLEQHDPQKERTCDQCEVSLECPFIGTSPVVSASGAEVKCIVVDRGDSTLSLLIPTQVEVSRAGTVEGFRVTVHRFRQKTLWRWIRRTFG